jgi:hypothetical protein
LPHRLPLVAILGAVRDVAVAGEAGSRGQGDREVVVPLGGGLVRSGGASPLPLRPPRPLPLEAPGHGGP